MANSTCPMPPAGFTTNLRGGISPRLIHTGGAPAVDTAAGNNSTPGATTEIYVAEIFVPFPCNVQGIAIFNGSDVTDNVKAALYDAAGVIVASTASTAGGTLDTYQRVPFALLFTAVASATSGTSETFTQLRLSPGTYYIATDYAGTTSRFNTHAVGSFGANKITGAVFATAMITTSLIITPPVAFTTALGPIASLY